MKIRRKHFIGRAVHDISPRNLANIYYQADQALFNTGGIQIFESSVCNTEGERRKVVFNKAVFTLADGSIGRLVGIILDVVGRERNESKAKDVFRHLQKNREIAFLQLLTPHIHRAFTKVGDRRHKKAKRTLTIREQTVLEWVRIGKSNVEIATILKISPWTVKIHVSNVPAKLNASSRLHTSSKAISSGLVEFKNGS